MEPGLIRAKDSHTLPKQPEAVSSSHRHFLAIMADDAEAIHAAELKKKRQFRKYSYRGVDLEDLLDKSSEEVGHSEEKH